jgi:hypothetical protein
MGAFLRRLEFNDHIRPPGRLNHQCRIVNEESAACKACVRLVRPAEMQGSPSDRKQPGDCRFDNVQ